MLPKYYGKLKSVILPKFRSIPTVILPLTSLCETKFSLKKKLTNAVF